MNSQKLISVIIPVYNNEKYIEGAVNSLINQTYKNIEIIVVNDGSKDNTQQKLDALGKRDKRVKVINKENGGVSSARNAGLDAADGELIAFLDSDDEYLPNALETMLSELDDDADMLVCSLRKIWNKAHDDRYEDMVISKQELYDNYFSYSGAIHYCCANLYRAEIIKKNNLRFNEKVHFSEDYEFNLSYIKCAENNIKISSKIVYCYMMYRSGEHEKKDYPKRDIDVIVNFYGGKENMPEEVYNKTLKVYLTRCINRNMSWYGVRKTAENVKEAFEDCGDYINEASLKLAFSEQQAEYLLKGDYLKFTRDYYKTHRYALIDKYRFRLSKFALKIMKKE